MSRRDCTRSRRFVPAGFWLIGLCLLIAGCTRPPANPEPAPAPPSQIKVDVKPGGPIVLTTSSAEFQILPSGYIQASLLKGRSEAHPGCPRRRAAAIFWCKTARKFSSRWISAQAKVQDSAGKLGRGKRVEIPVRPLDGPSSLQQASGYAADRSLRRLPECAAIERGIQEQRLRRSPHRSRGRAATQVQRQPGGQKSAAL